MSIYLRTGQPGHGKTYGAIRVIKEALEHGQWVATNIELKPGWALTMARMNLVRRMIPGRVAKTAADYERRLWLTHDLAELGRLRLPPCGKCDACKRSTESAPERCRKEGRGRAVLDEAHNWLNARTWDADETGAGGTKAQAIQRRLSIVRFFSQHRKLGWHVDLITQDDQNLDRQVRSLFEYHVHLKNLRRFKVFGLFPVVPVNVFVAVTTWHDNDKSRLGVETFLLSRKLARCYDTTATSHGLDFDAPDAIWLGRADPSGGTDGPSAARPPDVPPPVGPPCRSLLPSPLRVQPGSSSGGDVPLGTGALGERNSIAALVPPVPVAPPPFIALPDPPSGAGATIDPVRTSNAGASALPTLRLPATTTREAARADEARRSE